MYHFIHSESITIGLKRDHPALSLQQGSIGDMSAEDSSIDHILGEVNSH